MLEQIISQYVRQKGPVPFSEFMEMALYYPELGYYNRQGQKIGADGDYYTSPTISPLFGALIGRQIEEMWEHTGKEAFTIVEYGAGSGIMCRDILCFLKTNSELYSSLAYYIIEKSPVMRKLAQSHLHGEVVWIESIRDLPPFTGCILSNELLDNFAVHQVVMKQQLMEVFVVYNEKGFTEVLLPAGQPLKDYLNEMNILLPEGLRTEINLQAAQWIKEIATVLKKGYLMTIDYGGPSSELYTECRRDGTLACFKNHMIGTNPYKNIGLQDITSHVNFSALCHFGGHSGLTTCGYTTQAGFLLALGFTKFIRACEERGQLKPEYGAAIYRMLIQDMGMKFKVLIQEKGNIKKKLLGLQLAKKTAGKRSAATNVNVI
jgi:SAM-dependent MidA family methyltransferase